MLLKFVSLTRLAMVWLAMKAPEDSAAMVVRSNSLGVALMRDEEAALVDDQRGAWPRCALATPANRSAKPVDVFLDELGQGGHVMRIAERSG